MRLALFATATLGLTAAAGPRQTAPTATEAPACITMNTKQLPLASRKSPLDSVSFTVGGKPVMVCYGRPSLRGRTMIGGEAVPYGKLWRTGANEPTMIHTSGPLSIAGLKVPAGTYSLYTVPGPTEWEVIVNRSITQWGEEHNYTDEVKSKEVGRAKVKADKMPAKVEQFTIRPEPPSGDASALLLEWQDTRIRIPLGPGQ
ncbi:MAG TPA: DUF2911 domain-containing protein [Gemmatimonadales bacterium]|nr:DUF2911 domain-containing protein [Gemmatimonadales bacterium]